MATSISGSIYYTGLSNMGTDWTETLEKLKEIESIQLNRLQAWQDDWNLRYQAFGKIIEAAQTAKNEISTLKNRDNFVSKLVTSSQESVITGTATSTAQDVQHTINVKQMASNSVWANKHVFSSKNDIINATDQAVDFKFTYAGKTVSISVPANTTLDSFISLVNNSTENPGITLSTVKTANGYLFQVAGKDTGLENNLVIYNCDLVGMSAAGTNSSWETSKTIDTSEILHNPTQFSYELVYDNGTTKSITISGDSTLDDLVKAINAQTGRNIASLDPTTGALKLDGVQSFKRRDSSTKADTLDTLKVYAGTQEDMSKPLVENGTGADLTFDILVDKGLGYQSTVSITVKDTATREEFLATLAQATGNTTNMSMDKDGSWYLSLSGVVSITPRSGDLPDGISAVEVAGTSLRVRVPQYRGAVLGMEMDGERAGDLAYAPYEFRFDGLTPGTHEMGITVYGNRVNGFGCVHNCDDSLTWYGPDCWRSTGIRWCYEYRLRRMGLLVSPQIETAQGNTPD